MKRFILIKIAECQLWAIWALANLTQWEETKYCPLVAREGGVEAIQGILARCLTAFEP